MSKTMIDMQLLSSSGDDMYEKYRAITSDRGEQHEFVISTNNILIDDQVELTTPTYERRP